MGKLRDKETSKTAFLDAAQKVSRMLFNEALGMLPYTYVAKDAYALFVLNLPIAIS
jgi:uracil phosphoribosyltransferase